MSYVPLACFLPSALCRLPAEALVLRTAAHAYRVRRRSLRYGQRAVR